jgi:hypothetical protein
MKRQLLSSCSIAAIGFLLPSLAFGITAGQVANFGNDDLQGWTNGGGHPNTQPVIIGSGGPTGGSNPNPNPYLQVSSGFVDDTSYAPKLVTLNRGTSWIGDYVTPGITSIDMDLKNFSPGDPNTITLPIRIAFLSQIGDAPGYISPPFSLLNDGAWHHASFSLSSTNLLPYLNPPPLSQVLSNAGGTGLAEIRILAASSLTATGDLGSYRLGIDNITAVLTPVHGDWDRNGTVNGNDVQAMLNALTDLNAYKFAKGLDDTGLVAQGDFNNDQKITNADIQAELDLVAPGPGAGAVAGVPEPASWLLLGLGAAVVLGGRRSRRTAA